MYTMLNLLLRANGLLKTVFGISSVLGFGGKWLQPLCPPILHDQSQFIRASRLIIIIQDLVISRDGIAELFRCRQTIRLSMFLAFASGSLAFCGITNVTIKRFGEMSEKDYE